MHNNPVFVVCGLAVQTGVSLRAEGSGDQGRPTLGERYVTFYLRTCVYVRAVCVQRCAGDNVTIVLPPGINISVSEPSSKSSSLNLP